MNRWMMGAAAAALVLTMGVVGVSAAQTGQRCRLWQTDRCGAQAWEGCRYTDTDGDGVCDNQGSGLCSGGSGNWIDSDGDGLCDCMGLGTGRHGGHHGRNW